ncbi:MAG: polyprenyl synthetase family protein [bacterium]|nr:polyprenyl synthetase family protein [bacterium]
MEKFLRIYKPPIEAFLDEFLKKKEKELSKINPWGRDALRRLRVFVKRGKTLRGALVILSYLLKQKKVSQEAIAAAAALELAHSSLLIHDDIMDEDFWRRGRKTIFAQYAALAPKRKKARHFGESMGICAGNLGFFLAFEILPERLRPVFTKELVVVDVGQMQDVYFVSGGRISRAEVLRMYRYKTARYTFSLPFLMGGILAGLPLSSLRKLEKFGELCGIVFQLRDDELDGSSNVRFLKGERRKFEKKALAALAALKLPQDKKRLLEAAFLFAGARRR